MKTCICITSLTLFTLPQAVFGSPLDSLPQAAEAFANAMNQRNFTEVAASTNRVLPLRLHCTTCARFFPV